MEDITTILNEWAKNKEYLSILAKKDEELRIKIKIYLKENKFDKYKNDDTGINISIVRQEMEVFDKMMLRLMLDDAKYNSVRKIKVIEKMMITTPDDREKMKKYFNRGGKTK